jgi:hypothetical protein
MDAVATRRLEQPVVDDGIRWLNFFNGRVLSAEDLRTDHDAIAEARRQLGRGIGAGVVAGLEVSEAILVSSPGSPILTVRKGLAFNEDGQALELRRDVTVGLVRVDAPTGGAGADFANCDVVLPGTAGLGVYVLTVGPAASDVGKAVVAGLGNQPANCNTAYSVEGVRFKLFPVPLEDGDLDEPDLLRNRIAYRMFGAGATERWTAGSEPFNVTPAQPTLFEAMRASCFSKTDVPIALLHWRPVDGIRFIDLWAVRRRPAGAAVASPLASAASDAMAARAEAAVLQFRDHLGDIMRPSSQPHHIRAVQQFEHLPPVGILPLRTAAHPRGLDPTYFFDTLTVSGEGHVDAASVDALIRSSVPYGPIDLASGELIWLYRVRQNRQATDVDPSVPVFLVFTTGYVPYAANARFNLAYWDFANYAEI